MDQPNRVTFTAEYIFGDNSIEARRLSRLVLLAGIRSKVGEYVMLSSEDYDKLVMAVDYWRKKAEDGQNPNGPR